MYERLVQIADRAAVRTGHHVGSPEEIEGSPPPVAEDRRLRLERLIADLGSVVVAYSGGVDSSLVLRVAVAAIGARALGVIGRSDSYASRELELALAQARSFGARVEIVPTGELADPDFRSNPAQRCYYCKHELYRRLAEVARREGAAAVLDGTIVDDLGDWRPGRRAAAEYEVRSPLAELGFTKEDVRRAARELGLASHDKPASPCLASRIPYGTEITRTALSRIEAGEELLRRCGFRELRLRHHGDVARIEVPPCDLQLFSDRALRSRVLEGLIRLGYEHVVLDLDGFRSGRLNDALRTGRIEARVRDLSSDPWEDNGAGGKRPDASTAHGRNGPRAS